MSARQRRGARLRFGDSGESSLTADARLGTLRVSVLAALLAVVPMVTVAAEEAPALKAGDWVEHGFSIQEREGVRRAFQQGIDRKVVPGGSLLIVHQGEIIFREAFGLADLKSKRPFTADDLCRIASVTKPHTATLLAILADRGKLSLDDPIDKYLPEFRRIKVRGKGPAENLPTIKQILSHTAGFPGSRATKSGAYKINAEGDLSDAVASIANQELAAEPGTRHAYTGIGYFVAGRVAEVASGEPFDVLIEKVLLEPIGATETTFHPGEEAKKKVPTAYNRAGGRFELYSQLSKGSVVRPGGGLYSTSNGVARLMLLHRNRGTVDGQEIVSPTALAQMYVAQPRTPGRGYGLGLNILRKGPDGVARRIQHTGASGTLAWLDFDLDLIIVMLTQVPQSQTGPFRQQLMKTILEIFEE